MIMKASNFIVNQPKEHGKNMLKNRKAVITGASRGIGKAIALELAKQGADIALVDIVNREEVQAVCDTAINMGVKASIYFCDVSDYEASKVTSAEITKEMGGVDILINNAGITRDGLLMRMSEEDFDQVLSINLKGAFNFTKHLLRPLLKSPYGRIINIASVSGLTGNPGQVNYSAAKAGLIGMTKTIAKEIAGKGVTVNAIAPGFIETNMTAVLSDEVTDNIHKSIPLKRFGKVSDVAAAAVFLASDGAGYITGEVIRVDGGMCI